MASICSEEGLLGSLAIDPLGTELYGMLCDPTYGAIRNLDVTLVAIIGVLAALVVVYITWKASRLVIDAVRRG